MKSFLKKTIDLLTGGQLSRLRGLLIRQSDLLQAQGERIDALQTALQVSDAASSRLQAELEAQIARLQAELDNQNVEMRRISAMLETLTGDDGTLQVIQALRNDIAAGEAAVTAVTGRQAEALELVGRRMNFVESSLGLEGPNGEVAPKMGLDALLETRLAQSEMRWAAQLETYAKGAPPPKATKRVATRGQGKQRDPGA